VAAYCYNIWAGHTSQYTVKGSRNRYDGPLIMQVLAFYNLQDANKWEMLGYESLFFLAFLFLAWVSLAYSRHVRR
jgi:hypothetical protein